MQVKCFFTAYSYTVMVINDDEETIEEYTAGNNPYDSQGVVPADQGVGLKRMEQYCTQTAKEIAAEYGVTDIHVAPPV